MLTYGGDEKNENYSYKVPNLSIGHCKLERKIVQREIPTLNAVSIEVGDHDNKKFCFYTFFNEKKNKQEKFDFGNKTTTTTTS